MLSHHNIISNVVQHVAYQAHSRNMKDGFDRQTGLGILPFSHIYGLVIISHLLPYCGDQVIVLPKYELKTMLTAIEKYRINLLTLV